MEVRVLSSLGRGQAAWESSTYELKDNASIWGRKGCVAASIFSWLFGNLLLLPRGNHRPEEMH